MSNIFDEKEDLHNTKSIVGILRDKYNEKLRHKGDEVEYLSGGRATITGTYNIEPLYLRDPDETARCTSLALHWPGDDVVRQIILDTVKLLADNEIDPRDIAW